MFMTNLYQLGLNGFSRYGPVMTFMTNLYLLGLNGFSWVCQVLSVIVASERCFCILQPLRYRTVLRTSTMTAIIVVVNVVVVCLYFLVATRLLQYRLHLQTFQYSDSVIVIRL